MLVVLLCAGGARADLPVPIILWVEADLDQQQLTIHGVNFGTATPKVGPLGATLGVMSYSQTEILAMLPAGIDPGTYQLLIIRGLIPSLPFEVALGAGGGEPGPAR